MPLLVLGGGQSGPLYGVRVGAGPGLRLEGWLRWPAHSLGGAVCRDHTQFPAFAPAPQKWQWVFGLFVSCFSKFAPTARACSYF